MISTDSSADRDDLGLYLGQGISGVVVTGLTSARRWRLLSAAAHYSVLAAVSTSRLVRGNLFRPVRRTRMRNKCQPESNWAHLPSGATSYQSF